jgi:membrane-bound lytic murein transglycosylase D
MSSFVRAAVLVAVVVTGLGAPAANAFPAEFEKPSAIADNVAFWKRVYAEWRLDDIALHDEDDLGVVYTVLRVPKRGAKDAEGRTRPQAINAGRAKVEAALRSLQRSNPKDESKLEGLEREVFVALKKSKRPDKYARAHKIRAQNGLYERFVQGYANSGLYEQFISAELTRVGLPKELIGVAFVESLFYTGARSKVGAAGVWQFMSYTGKEYMQLNSVVDERYDPILATEAAAKYLKQAKKELSTWPLAITSYNYGRGGMRGLAKGAGTNDFNVILAVSKNKRFGFAARNYYASFLAVLEILDEQKVRFAGVTKKGPWSYDVARMPFPVFSTQLTATGHVDQATLEWLNPALTDEAARGRLPLPHGMSLRLPKGKADDIIAALNALPARDKGKAQRAAKAIHTASGKESVAAIAKKYGVNAEVLAARTGTGVSDVIGKGQRIAIPPPSPKTSLLPEARNMPVPPMVVSAPVLLADAAELLPDAVAPPKPHVGLGGGAVLTSGLKGTISVGRVRSELVEAPGLPGVDAIAGGAFDALPAVDVLAGAIATDANDNVDNDVADSSVDVVAGNS